MPQTKDARAARRRWRPSGLLLRIALLVAMGLAGFALGAFGRRSLYDLVRNQSDFGIAVRNATSSEMLRLRGGYVHYHQQIRNERGNLYEGFQVTAESEKKNSAMFLWFGLAL